MKVSTVSQMRQMDSTAIEEYGIEDTILMENAGHAAYSIIDKEIGVADKKFIVFCGGGNNGGDGFVVARKIFSNGGVVKVFLLCTKDSFKGAARKNLKILESMPIAMRKVENVDSIRSNLYHCDVIVDAIFGTGLTRNVEGIHKEIIDAVNMSGKSVISLDIPSGIAGDSGQVMGAAIKADYTVTFGLPKIGNILYPGFAYCGDLTVTHISFPPAIYETNDVKVRLNDPQPLPPRYENGHKGDFGDVLFIAGAASYYGAPYFSALSFLKAGGGYSRLAGPKSMIPFIANKGSEIVFAPQTETTSGGISLENKDGLLSLAENTDMTVIGPGLSLDPQTQKLVRELAFEIKKPLVIDGDGITAVVEDLDIIKNRTDPTILTPHLGEMSRITGLTPEGIINSPIETTQECAANLNAYVVLKGAHSLVCCPDGKLFINLTGNSGMATAGSGDVLTGTIAAMFALGLDIEEAVKKGVHIHGFAGDLATVDIGEDGITASDIMENLPIAVKGDREGYSIKINVI